MEKGRSGDRANYTNKKSNKSWAGVALAGLLMGGIGYKAYRQGEGREDANIPSKVEVEKKSSTPKRPSNILEDVQARALQDTTQKKSSIEPTSTNDAEEEDTHFRADINMPSKIYGRINDFFEQNFPKMKLKTLKMDEEKGIVTFCVSPQDGADDSGLKFVLEQDNTVTMKVLTKIDKEKHPFYEVKSYTLDEFEERIKGMIQLMDTLENSWRGTGDQQLEDGLALFRKYGIEVVDQIDLKASEDSLKIDIEEGEILTTLDAGTK